MSNITTANITGVFDLDTGRLIGIAPKGVNDVTYLPGQDTQTSGLPVTATQSTQRVAMSFGGIEFPGSGVMPLSVQATHGFIPSATRVASAGNLVCAETRRISKTGRAPLSELRLVFSGFWIANGTGVETVPGNTQSLQAAIELPGAPTQVVQVTFGGSNTGTIPDGVAEYLSDPIYPGQFGLTQFPANTTFWYRERRVVTSGQIHTKGQSSQETGEGTYYSDGLAASQLVATGVMTLPAGGANASCEFGPSAFLGRSIGVPDVSCVIIGDSLFDGTNDNQIGGIGNGGGGYVMRGLYSVAGRTVPSIKMACGGTQAQYFAAGFLRRRAFLKYVTHALCNYGTNDAVTGSRTAAQVLADLRVIWGVLKGGDSNIRHVVEVGIIPRTTSTDSFATVANQTPRAGFETGGAFRSTLNAALQGYVGTEIDEYIDVSPAFYDPAQPARWAVGSTADGTHYSPAAAVPAAAYITAAAASWT